MLRGGTRMFWMVYLLPVFPVCVGLYYADSAQPHSGRWELDNFGHDLCDLSKELDGLDHDLSDLSK